MGEGAGDRLTARDQAVRDEILASADRSLLVEAAAGTGKTTLLVDRILRSVRDGAISLARTVAITFTEKAAGELDARLRAGLAAELARPDLPLAERRTLATAAEELDRAAISTIHGFCARLLRERAVDAGVDPEFAVLDAAGAELLRERCWREWIDLQVSTCPPELVEALRAGVGAADLRAPAFALCDAPEVVEALDEALNRPSSSLAELVDLVRRAVPEAARACEEGLTGRTNVHSRSWLRLTTAMRARLQDDVALRRYAYELGAAPLDEALRSFDRAERDRVRAVLSPLAEAARRLGNLVAAGVCDLLAGFVRHYASVKLQKSVLDFQDLLFHASRMLRDDLGIRAYFQRRFDAVFVDEFQDTDPLQAELVAYLCEDPGAEPARAMEGVTLAAGKLFVVGDPKQSIYRFRRADVQVYDRFKDLFAGAAAGAGGLRRIGCNFRSVPALLSWCNETFAALFQPSDDPSVYQAEYVPLEPPLGAAAPQGPAVAALCPPPEAQTDDWNAEAARRHEAAYLARALAEAVAGRLDGHRWRYGDFAFLLRALVDVDIYTDALEALGIPHRLVGGRHFYQREQIVETLAVLQAVDDPLDEAAVVAALRSSYLGLSDEDLLRHRRSGGGWNYLADRTDAGPADAFERFRRWHRNRNRVAAHVLLREILRETGARAAFLRKPAGAQRAANLDKLADHLRLLWPAAGNFGAVVRHLTAMQEAELPEEESGAVEPGDDFVQIMSMHKAKGLEFPAVVLPDLPRRLGGAGGPPALVLDRAEMHAAVRLKAGLATRGYDELAQTESANERAELRRLLYVACTRAERWLVLPLYWQPVGGSPDASFQAMLAETGKLAPPDAVPFGEERGGVRYLDTRGWHVDAARRGSRADERGAEVDVQELVRGRSRWAEEHDRAIRRSRHAEHFVLPSALDAEGGRPRAPEEPGIGGREFGTLFHDLLADAPVRPDDRGRVQTLLHGLSRGHADRLGLGEQAAAEAAELALTALTHPALAGLLKTADIVRREVPFAVPLERLDLPDGMRPGLMEGSIDLLVAGAGGSVVVDYKTDRVSAGDEAERATLYWPQLALYALAVEACCGGPPPDVALFFVRTGAFLRRALDGELVRSVSAVIEEQSSGGGWGAS